MMKFVGVVKFVDAFMSNLSQKIGATNVEIIKKRILLIKYTLVEYRIYRKYLIKV